MTSPDRPFTDRPETEDVAPELNPELDRAEIADAFRRTGRVHIPDILTDASARRLFRTLERETPWGLIFNEGKKTRSSKQYRPQTVRRWRMPRGNGLTLTSNISSSITDRWSIVSCIQSRAPTSQKSSHS